MGYIPPKGVRPPQLEGRRTGRPKGSRSSAQAWRDAIRGLEHADDDYADPPTGGARVWWLFAERYPDELEEFLHAHGQL
jgi:hypothetical protein